MSGPKDELERERHRAIVGALTALHAATVQLQATVLASQTALTTAIQALTSAEVERARLERERPLRQLMAAFLAADWKGKLIFLSPLIASTLLAYSLAVGDSPAAVAGDLLQTARICATGAALGPSAPLPPTDEPTDPNQPRAVTRPDDQ